MIVQLWWSSYLYSISQSSDLIIEFIPDVVGWKTLCNRIQCTYQTSIRKRKRSSSYYISFLNVHEAYKIYTIQLWTTDGFAPEPRQISRLSHDISENICMKYCMNIFRGRICYWLFKQWTASDSQTWKRAYISRRCLSGFYCRTCVRTVFLL